VTPAAAPRRFDVIGFDADDTLWHSEDSFHAVEARFVELLSPHIADGVDVRDALRATERHHVPISGYGVKAFTLSMVECAVTVTQGAVPASVIGDVVALGMAMLTEPVRLLPDVVEALADVGSDHRLVLITKGDLVHQWRKLEMSGLAHHFAHVDVVREKDEATYRRVLADVDSTPERFCMVGNSVRSDVLPVLAIGGHAVHIEYEYTWEHEVVEHDAAVVTAASILEVPALVRSLGSPEWTEWPVSTCCTTNPRRSS
jgi:putative hydrolase of the HAD superfamily